jgi:glycosyltransferase involved in cell wall biosynthesis
MNVGMFFRSITEGSSLSFVPSMLKELLKSNKITLFAERFDYIIKSRNFKFQKMWASDIPLLDEAIFPLLSTKAVIYEILNPYSSKGFDAIYSHGPRNPLADAIGMHFCFSGYQNEMKKKGIKCKNILKFYSFWEKLSFAVSSYKIVITPSNFMRNQLNEHLNIPNHKIRVVPYGVNTKEFHQSHVKRSNTLLFIGGNPNYRKGLQFLITAMKNIDKRFKLLIMGGDTESYMPLVKFLKLQDRIKFLGFISDNSVKRKFMQTSRLLIQPTLYEPFGLAPLEAMACGLPVAISKDAGVSEIMTDGKDGFLIDDPTNPRNIAETVNEAIHHNVSNECRRTAEKHSWEVVAEGWNRCFEEVMG